MKFLLLFLIAFNAFGQASNPNDTLKIGKKNSSADKGLIFETNDGVLNKTLKVNPTSKYLIYSGNDVQLGDGASSNDKQLIIDPSSATKLNWNGIDSILELQSTNTSIKSSGNVNIESQDIKIGEGSDADTKIEFDIGLGATNPKIKWDTAKQKFRQSIGGTDKDLGSGSGSGGGANYNNAFTADNNANAEDGLTGWTASAGTFALETTDPLEGDQSWNWTPAAQNDTLDSPVLDVDKDIFLGRSCEANIEYIGGDENLTLQVIDADNDVLGEEVLKAHSISSSESVFFLCPSSSGTANDKDLRFRLINSGASASALIKFDKAYVGTLVGLSETTLPDEFSAKFNTINGTLLENEGGVFSSCSNVSTGRASCVLIGLSETPSCVATITNAVGGRNVSIGTLTSSSLIIETDISGTPSPMQVDVKCNKNGTDAKQSVQVYKSIPKVSENLNEFGFSLNTSNSTNILREYGEMSVSCSMPQSGEAQCSFTALSSIPVCTATVTNSSVDHTVILDTLTVSSFRVRTRQAGSLSAAQVDVNCSKSGSDFKMPTVQPVIVGQVTSYDADARQKNKFVDICYSTSAVSTHALCSNWIASGIKNSTGNYTYTFEKPFSDTSEVVCIASMAQNSPYTCRAGGWSTTSVTVNCYDNDTSSTPVDTNHTFFCTGDKK